MSRGRGSHHAWGSKSARVDGDYSGADIVVVGMYSQAMRRHGVIQARSLGQLTATPGGGNGGEHVGGRPVGMRPQATCWCERVVVDVTWDDVVEGRTGCCGTARCRTIAKQMRVTP
jgi:hypothetical protein